MSRQRSWVRAVAAVLVIGLAAVWCSGSKPAHKAPDTAVTVVRSASTPSASTSGSTPDADVANHGIVTGRTGTCTCAGGGVFQPGSANESKPRP